MRSIRYVASLKAKANLIGWSYTIFYLDDILGFSIYKKKPLLRESFKIIQTDYLSSSEVSNWLFMCHLDLNKATAFWPLSNF